MNTSTILFTRYLYFKAEVINTLEWSILDKQLEESLYWAYEMYFSGFKKEIFEFLLLFCSKYNSEIYPHYYTCIEDLYRKWDIKKDDYLIGKIVKLLVSSKVSITNLLRLRQKVRIINEELIANVPHFEIPSFSEQEVHKYKTIKLTTKMHNWSFLDQVACKYIIRRVTCNELLLFHPNVEIINFDKWMYYASNTPIWRQRISKFSGVINDEYQTVEVEQDEFHNQYDYEPDEQSQKLKEMLWGNDLKNYANLSLIEFAKKYGIDNVYQKCKINPKRNMKIHNDHSNALLSNE